jgi:hypothetical protein
LVRDVEEKALSAFVAASAAYLVVPAVSDFGTFHCETLCERAIELEIEHLRNLSAALLTTAG